MTAEELNGACGEANWLIARRSASAAGKALMFSSESLDETIADIAALYGLSEDEVAGLLPQGDGGAVADAQKLANGLFGSAEDPNANPAVKAARTAIRSGRASTIIGTLLRAGPKAVQSAATTGAAASKGTHWGWIATATYAAGTAGWFAYSARAFNLRAFEFVRDRDGIVLAAPPAEEPVVSDGGADAGDTVTLRITLPTASAVAARARHLPGRAGAMLGGMFGRLRRPTPAPAPRD